MTHTSSLGQSRERAVRLVTLALALSHRPVTLHWLRDELGLYTQANADSGRMQFERDKAALQAAGVEIEVEGNTYRATGSAIGGFMPDELDALTVAASMVADPATGAALAAFAARADAYPDVRHTDRVLQTVPEATALADAIAGRTSVTFRYRPVNGPAGERHLEPWGLRARRGLWYVVGHDLDRGAHRHFRLDRIEGHVQPGPPATAPRPDTLPTDLLPGDAGRVRIQLGDRGHFEARRLGAALAPDGPDDTGEVVATFAELRDEVALGVALANDAEIIEPESLERERRLRAQFVTDRHSLPAPDVPDDLHGPPQKTVALDDARLRRLLALPGWLAERVEVTVEEAVRGLGVSRDELEEDLDVLREVTLPGVGDVVDTAISDDGTIEHVVAVTVPLRLGPLDRGRVRSLLSATAVMEPARAPAITTLVRRLDAPTVVAVDPEEHAEQLLALRRARDERRIVELQHQARDRRSVQQRRLTPTRVDWADGHLYVGGFDHDRGEGRWFRLDRIADLRVGEVDPEPRDVELAPIRYEPVGEEVEVVLRCSHVGTWVLSRLVPDQRIVIDGDHWALVRTDTPEVLADHVMIAGGEVEVVAPRELRSAVQQRAALLH